MASCFSVSESRREERVGYQSGTGVMTLRGRRHVVRIGNISSSGAMVFLNAEIALGEDVTLQLLDRGLVSAQVRWTGDGRIGLQFVNSTEPPGWR